MLRALKTKVGLILLTCLVAFGIVDNVFYPDVSYGATEEVVLTSKISYAKTPEIITQGNDIVTIDLSNTGRGYFAAKYTGGNERVKLIISKNGYDEDIIYDIPVEKYNEYIVLPFHAGNGEYSISVWEYVSGMLYKSVFSDTRNVEMYDEVSSFLYPSLNVDFDGDSLAVHTAAILARSSENDRELAKEVFNWITATIEYDYAKEADIKAGMRYITQIDEVMLSKKGICLDYATIMVAMLRSQGVPAKVVVGLVEYQGEILFPKHSWVSVYFADETGGEWVDFDPTFKTTKEKGVKCNNYSCRYSPEYSY